MNCREFEKIVLALARNQLLEAVDREEGLMHTEVCARCASRLTEEQAIVVGVRAVIVEIAKEEAPAHVEAALLAAFREQAAAAALPILISKQQGQILGTLEARRGRGGDFAPDFSGGSLLDAVKLTETGARSERSFSCAAYRARISRARA
jgi:hypothetical protein